MGQDALQEIQRELARRIRDARVAAGLTQEDVAGTAGIDYKRFQRIEGGTVNLTVRTIMRIASALKMDFWSLLAPPPRRKRRRR